MTTQAGVAVRVIATRVVDAVMHRGRSLKAELAANLPRIEDARDRALLEAICFAALRSRVRGEAAIAAWMSKPRDQPTASCARCCTWGSRNWW